MTPFKTLILENEMAYIALKLLSIVGCVALLGVISVLSLEGVAKLQEWRRNRIRKWWGF